MSGYNRKNGNENNKLNEYGPDASNLPVSANINQISAVSVSGSSNEEENSNCNSFGRVPQLSAHDANKVR